jgi:chorismate mutase/prephenate dehydratase
MKELKSLRKKVDKLDLSILDLLNKRAKLILEIGKMKAKKGAPVFVPDREKEVYTKISAANKGPLTKNAVKAIYREVMSGSLALERAPMIAYLGPPATFTHLASMKKFGSAVKYLACNSITDVFQEVEQDRADYGVVPIENSIEGAVSHTLDMFIDTDLKVCSEVILEISHNLLGKCKLKQIKKIYSNPQVFGQCRIWLETNLPRVELIEVSSTTKAAEIAAKEKYSAAIASSLAAQEYKLKLIARSIEDSAHNITRFLVIGKVGANPTKNDKTSIMFSVKDRVGALHQMLVPFKENKINLTKIESRPSKRKAWEYYFFVDFKGHHQNKNVKKALNKLEKICSYLKILGSYPALD